MYFAQTEGGYKLPEIAKHFGLELYWSVSSAMHITKKTIEADKKVLTEVK